MLRWSYSAIHCAAFSIPSLELHEMNFYGLNKLMLKSIEGVAHEVVWIDFDQNLLKVSSRSIQAKLKFELSLTFSLAITDSCHLNGSQFRLKKDA